MVVEASDRQDSDTLQFNLIVTNINDAPLITKAIPEGDTIIQEGDSLEFSVLVLDPDQGEAMNFSWFNNGILITNSLNYWLKTDFQSSGIDTIRLNVSDGDTTSTVQWLVTISNKSIPPSIFMENSLSLNDDSILMWLPSSDPDLQSPVHYTIQVGLEAGFDSSLLSIDTLDDNQIGLRKLLFGLNLEENQQLYWRVKANDSIGYSTDFTDGSNNFFYSRLTTGIGNLQPNLSYIHRNEPNPFGSITVFEYGISHGPQTVSLRIYNSKGEMLEEIIEGDRSPGRYKGSWNSTGYPPGIYCYYGKIGTKVVLFGRMLKIK